MKIQLPIKQGLYCFGIALALHFPNATIAKTNTTQVLANQNVLPSGVGLTKVLPELESKFKISFVFKNDDLSNISIPVKVLEAATLNEAIQLIELYANVKIEQTGAQVYSLNTVAEKQPTNANTNTSKAGEKANTKSAVAPIQVSGTVTDENGNPIPGVAVVVLGGTTTTVTDFNGKFTIEADEAATLQFRFVGYETTDIAVIGRSNFSVQLKPSLLQTKDVVVVGYGTKTKKEISSSIGSVNAKEITATPVADPAQALQGRVAGLQVIQNSGAPGGTGGTSIRIRGISSVNGSNNPLIVLDG
ncbi:MAG: carboxypeptidase-like regulatory domain-containing protein, partial [Flexibacteraceae bacterium]